MALKTEWLFCAVLLSLMHYTDQVPTTIHQYKLLKVPTYIRYVNGNNGNMPYQVMRIRKPCGHRLNEQYSSVPVQGFNGVNNDYGGQPRNEAGPNNGYYYPPMQIPTAHNPTALTQHFIRSRNKPLSNEVVKFIKNPSNINEPKRLVNFDFGIELNPNQYNAQACDYTNNINPPFIMNQLWQTDYFSTLPPRITPNSVYNVLNYITFCPHLVENLAAIPRDLIYFIVFTRTKDLEDILYHLSSKMPSIKPDLMRTSIDYVKNHFTLDLREEEEDYIELERFILDLQIKNGLNPLSPNLIEYIQDKPNLLDIVRHIFELNVIPTTYVNPNLVTLLLKFMLDRTTNRSIKNIPQELIDFLLHVNEDQGLKSFVLDWLHQKEQTIKQPVNTIKENPAYLELEKMILDLTLRHKLIDISPELLKFLELQPDLQKTVLNIFQKNNIPMTKITPQTVTSLLELIKNRQTKKPVADIPQNLIEFVLNLDNAGSLGNFVLDWIKEKKPSNMNAIFLHIVKANEHIPQILRNWLMTSPEGKIMLEFLEKPGERQCLEETDSSVSCTKDVSDFVPDDVRIELETFIQKLNTKELTDVSPKLLQFLIKHPDLNKIIMRIFQMNNISTAVVNPQSVAMLLQLIKENKTNIQIKEIPQQLIELVFQLKGAEKLGIVALDWISAHKKPDMIAMFLQIIEANGGKDIPDILRNWLLTLSNGQEILEFLEKPGTIECKKETNHLVHCVKTIFSLTRKLLDSVSEDLRLELLSFIKSLYKNQLVDISPYLLDHIPNNPDLYSIVNNIFQKNNLPTTKINPETVITLLQRIRDTKTGKTLEELPSSLQELMTDKDLRRVTHDWNPLTQQPYFLSSGEFTRRNNEITKKIVVPTQTTHTAKKVDNNVKKTSLTNDEYRRLFNFQFGMSLNLNPFEHKKKKIVGLRPCEFNIDPLSTMIQLDQMGYFSHLPFGITRISVYNILKYISFCPHLEQNMKALPNYLIQFILKTHIDDLEKIIYGLAKTIPSINLELIVPSFRAVKNYFLLDLETYGYTELPEEQPIFSISFGSEYLPDDPSYIELKKFILGIHRDNKLKMLSKNFIRFIAEVPDLLKRVNYVFVENNIPTTYINPKLITSLLQFMKDRRDKNTIKDISHELLKFLLQVDGAQVLKDFALDWWLSLNKKSSNNFENEPAYLEMEKLIMDLTTKNKLSNVSSNLLRFIEKYPELLKLVLDIFKKNNIPMTKINPQTVTLFLELLKNKETKKPVKDIPQNLIEFVLNLDLADSVGNFVLDWVKQNKLSNMMSIVLHIVKANGGKNIPQILLNWLLTSPENKKMLEFLKKPGEIKCIEESSAPVSCTKDTDFVPNDIRIELETFIQKLNTNHLKDVSPKLLEFLLQYPNLQTLILNIFEKNNIPTTVVNPKIVTSLLQLITDNKTNKPVKDMPKSLINLVLNLKGAENLVKIALDWANKNDQPNMMNIFLQIIKANGGKGIPPVLRNWLLKSPNGKQTIQILEKPGSIECHKELNDTVKCVKSLVPEDINLELIPFIQKLINKQLTDISPNVLQFISNNPELYPFIQDIFQKNNIADTNVNPNIVTSLLQLINNSKTNKPIKVLPQSLISFVLHLQGNENLVEKLLDWTNTNDQPNIMHIILQIVKANGGKDIPQVLRNWLLNSPNGQQTIQLLEKPGSIDCHEEPSAVVKCIKNLVPKDIQLELIPFIKNLINNKLTDISPSVSQFISNNPDLSPLMLDIFQKNNIADTKVNPNIVTLLLQLINNSKTNKPIKDLPQSLISFVLQLQGNEILVEKLLDWTNTNDQPNIMHIILQIVKANGGKDIPQVLRNWLLNSPNGQQTIQLLEKPGSIDCHEEPSAVVKCIKNLVPKDIQLEIIPFIQKLINKQLIDVSPNILQFISNNPNLYPLILDVFQKNNIADTKVNPNIVTSLLQLINNSQTNTPIKDLPQSLISFVLDLQGNENLVTKLLDWVNKNDQPNLMNIILQIANGGKGIPLVLRNWLLNSPNGQQTIQLLEKPGSIECYQEPNASVKCIKNLVPKDIQLELIPFIQKLINKQLTDISPNVLQFISNNPDLYSLVLDVFQKNNIADTNVNPNMVTLLLQLINDNKTNKPIKDIPQSLISFVLDLQGNEKLVEKLLIWTKKNNQPNMMELFLQIIKANGGKDIPQVLRNWLLTLPNGQEVLDDLAKPGVIECVQQATGAIKCVKTLDLVPIPEEIKTEMQLFITGLNNNKLTDVSPKLLQFISNNPDLILIMTEIFNIFNIPTTAVNPKSVSLLLQLIKDNQTNKQIKEIPQELIELVLKLKGADKLGHVALNWISENKQPDMIAMFLQIIKANGGKDIPQILRNWLLSLSNGKEIIEYLEKPGTIECNKESNNLVHCVKTVFDISGELFNIKAEETFNAIPHDLQVELNTFIQSLNNNELVDISSNLLEFISKNPNLQSVILDVFQKFNISSTKVSAELVTSLLKLIIDNKSGKKIDKIPQSLISFVLKLKGAETLGRITLDWASESKKLDLMQMFLQIIEANGGKDIPPILREWIISLPNNQGPTVLEFLERPGEIKCVRESEDVVNCVKTHISRIII